MAYPSTLSTLATPQASDRLNNPSHSTLHQNENSGITEIQTFVGLASGATASAIGTILYDVRSPDSNGGGHVQTAVKGGTGQTTYTKGNILVASSSSVLTKLAAGIDGQVLQASSVTATGLTWGNQGGTKISASGSVITVISPSTAETSLMSVVVPASTIGTNNAVRATLFIDRMDMGNLDSAFRVNFGTSSVFLMNIIAGNGASSVRGTIETTIVGRGNSASQLGTIRATFSRDNLNIESSSVLNNMAFRRSFLLNNDSGTNQTLGVTFKYSADDAKNITTTGGYVVEKIN